MNSWRRPLSLAVVWLALAIVYVLLAGSLSVNEALAGSVSAGLGVTWSALVARRSDLHFRGDGAVLRPAATAILSLPERTVRVGADLVRALAGRRGGGLLLHARDTGTGWARAEGSSAPTVRAVGLLAASVAPDSYVLRLDPRGAVVTHALSGDGMSV